MSSSKKEVREHRVGRLNEKIRLVDYCGDAFPILGSKSATKKALADGRIELNSMEADGSEFLEEGDYISLTGSGISEIKVLDMDLPVVYEDEYMLVINKPGGIAVNGNRYKTVENAVANKNIGNKMKDALPRPVACHRIDVPTKGLVVLAKTKASLINIGKAFEEERIKKEYTAIVHGKTSRIGSISHRIEGKKALTKFKRLRCVPSRNYENLSMLLVRPFTGRTHQIRIHLDLEGHLIVGDKEYQRGRKTVLGKGLYLCATKLEMRHPINNGLLQLEVELPARFHRLLDREESRF